MKVVQIGSNKGNDSLSENLLSNYEELEFGLFVEAIPLHINDLRKCYSKFKNITIENIAIKTPDYQSEKIKFYLHTNDAPYYGISSTSKEHILQHERDVPHLQGGKILEFELNCISLDDLFKKYNITNLDWLVLDTEGMDAKILLSLEWSKYNIKRVEFEYLHLKNDEQNILNLFKSMGYNKVDTLDKYKFDWAFEK
jgi:FkbM family methyltransferase